MGLLCAMIKYFHETLSSFWWQSIAPYITLSRLLLMKCSSCNLFSSLKFTVYISFILNEWMNDGCFRPWFCTCKAILGRGQPRLMRWILLWTRPWCRLDRSGTDLQHLKHHSFYFQLYKFTPVKFVALQFELNPQAIDLFISCRSYLSKRPQQIHNNSQQMSGWCVTSCIYKSHEMNAVLGPDSVLARLYWGGDNLG